MERPGEVEQVDLAPTLALGLGLPVPQNSVGRVIPGVLEERSLRDQLRFLHLNGHQLSCLLRDSAPDYQKGRRQETFLPESLVPDGSSRFGTCLVTRLNVHTLLTPATCEVIGAGFRGLSLRQNKMQCNAFSPDGVVFEVRSVSAGVSQ